MTHNTTLSKAIVIVLAGSAWTASTVQTASASTTMYNMYNAADTERASDGPTYPDAGSQTGGTDGWVWGGIGFTSGGDPNMADPGWAGTTTGLSDDYSTYAPFGYDRAMPLNWAVRLTTLGDTAEISQTDAFSRYGFYADIDTAGGAWLQAVGNGWRHNIDIGLFKSDITQNVTLDVSGILHPDSNFGITLYDGLPTSTTFYNHHGPYFPYLVDLNSQPVLDENGDPIGKAFEGMPFLMYTPRDPLTGLTTNSLTFTAEADKIYTIILGGNNGENWNGKYDGYRLDISSAPVPIPGAVWLFGSALAGFVGIQRRKRNET